MAVVLAVLLALIAALFAWAWYRQFLVNGKHLIRIETLERQLQQVVTERDTGRAMHNAQAGMPHGSVLGDFELALLSGGTMTRTEWRGRPLLLVYVSPDDPFSIDTLRDLAALPLDGQDGRPNVVIVSSGSQERNRALVAETGIHFPVVLQEGWEATRLVQISATPSAYFVTQADATAGGLAVGRRAVLALVEAALAGDVPDPTTDPDWTPLPAEQLPAAGAFMREALPVGTPAPEIRLSGVNGDEVTLSAFRGDPVLVVFSQPDCPPCDEMSPDLAALARNQAVPRVVMIGRGDADANRTKAREFGFSFPVGLQQNWEVSREYGVVATPSAYLVDAEGRIASPIAVGTEAILTLGRTGNLPETYQSLMSIGYS